MKYFICSIDNISLGIPAAQTEQIISVTRTQDVLCETENGEVFISIPVLFRQKDAPHGVVLKPESTDPSAVKTVLLMPRINAEIEIPEEDIHSLPEALAGFYRYFRGACCSGSNLIFIINIEEICKLRICLNN